MVLSIIGYTSLIALLLTIAALVAERLSAELRVPRRWIWLTALVASLALPAYSMLTSSMESPTPTPAELTDDGQVAPAAPTDEVGSGVAALHIPPLPWPLIEGLDRALTWLWAVSSVLVLMLYGAVWKRLHRRMRRWPRVEVDGTSVVVSDRLGPAVFGFLAPKIIVPQWLLNLHPAARSMALTHEREHIAERDQLTLLIGLLAVAAAPWNLPMWWQLQRLRFAIEVDCDSRVTRRGIDQCSYARALLSVSQRREAAPLGVVALTERRSRLERRIRVMLNDTRRRRPLVVGSCTVLAVSLVIAACAVNAPDAGTGSAGPGVAPNYREADIRRVIEAVSQVTGKNFVVDRGVRAQITWLDNTPLDPPEFYSAFVQVLESHGYAALDAGDVVRIVPADATPL